LGEGVTHQYFGATTVNGGTLVVNGTINDTSSISVNAEGTLAGGALGSGGILNPFATLSVNLSGAISPGAGGPGILHTGSVAFASGSTFEVEINGAAPGTGYDQLDVVGGGVNLNSDFSAGANLHVTLGAGFAPSFEQTFTLIANADFGFVLGQFAMVNGEPLTAENTFSLSNDTGTYEFQLFYDGEGGEVTGGNDVVLRAVPEPSASVTLLGGLGLLLGMQRSRRRRSAA
jgi:hypothetical protein